MILNLLLHMNRVLIITITDFHLNEMCLLLLPVCPTLNCRLLLLLLLLEEKMLL